MSDIRETPRRQLFPIGDEATGQFVQTRKPLQVKTDLGNTPTLKQMALQNADICTLLTLEGRLFYASDADQDDLVTGQTSFANTTPTFLLNIPRGVTAIPLLVAMGQSGTVAGGAITIIVEVDNANRYSTGGTAETVFNSFTSDGALQNRCTLYSGATALAGFGARIMGKTVGADIDTAEGVDTEYLWTPTGGPEILVGPAAFLVYTYAATTGPSWLWTMKWLEIPTERLG